MDQLLKMLEECWPRGVPLPDARSKWVRVYIMFCGLAGGSLTSAFLIGTIYEQRGEPGLLIGMLIAPIACFFGVYMGVGILPWALPLVIAGGLWRSLA